MKRFFVTQRKHLRHLKIQQEWFAQAEDKRAHKCNRKTVSSHLLVGLDKDLQSHLKTKMTAISEIGLPPTMDFNQIRKTIETPPRVSVIDLIAVVSKVKDPRDV